MALVVKISSLLAIASLHFSLQGSPSQRIVASSPTRSFCGGMGLGYSTTIGGIRIGNKVHISSIEAAAAITRTDSRRVAVGWIVWDDLGWPWVDTASIVPLSAMVVGQGNFANRHDVFQRLKINSVVMQPGYALTACTEMI